MASSVISLRFWTLLTVNRWVDLVFRVPPTRRILKNWIGAAWGSFYWFINVKAIFPGNPLFKKSPHLRELRLVAKSKGTCSKMRIRSIKWTGKIVPTWSWVDPFIFLGAGVLVGRGLLKNVICRRFFSPGISEYSFARQRISLLALPETSAFRIINIRRPKANRAMQVLTTVICKRGSSLGLITALSEIISK